MRKNLTAREALAEAIALLESVHDTAQEVCAAVAGVEPANLYAWRRGRIDGLLDACNMLRSMGRELAELGAPADAEEAARAPNFPSTRPIPFRVVDAVSQGATSARSGVPSVPTASCGNSGAWPSADNDGHSPIAVGSVSTSPTVDVLAALDMQEEVDRETAQAREERCLVCGHYHGGQGSCVTRHAFTPREQCPTCMREAARQSLREAQREPAGEVTAVMVSRGEGEAS